MTSLTSLSAADVSRAVITFDALLRAQKEVINRLNVYPVPDGDTGTNMSLTMNSVVKALHDLGDQASLAEVTQAIATSSLMGARGNSGVILSQLLRGITKTFPSDGTVDVASLQAGLTLADELARQAVSRPVEGTILSVARAAAQGAASATSLEEAVVEARSAAKEALAKTPEQLPVLKRAGVVDSGGTGLVLWFDALCHVVTGEELPVTPALPTTVSVEELDEATDGESSIADLRYEVMFLLDGDDDAMPAFRAAWESLGDSIVIVGGDGFYNCHIHTDHIGPSIEAALAVGRPRDIRVTDLLEQTGEEGWVLEAAPRENVSAPTMAVVAVALGEGVAQLLTSSGVAEVVMGGQTMNPSTAELAAAVRATGASNVIVLPNNKNIRAVAEQLDAVVEATVRVVPTASVVEGLAALAGYRADDDIETNVTAMGGLAQHVVAGEVTQAVRDTTSDVGPVSAGDWIGLSADGIVAVAPTVAEASIALALALSTDEHELCTILEGEGSSDEVTAVICEAITSAFPEMEIERHRGDQPLYPYLFGFE